MNGDEAYILARKYTDNKAFGDVQISKEAKNIIEKKDDGIYAEVDTAIGEAIGKLTYLTKEIATATDIASYVADPTKAKFNVIYLLKDASAKGSDVYKEYQRLGDETSSTFECTGDTSTDLTGYFKNGDDSITIGSEASQFGYRVQIYNNGWFTFRNGEKQLASFKFPSGENQYIATDEDLSRLKAELQKSFQAGVDGIYNAIVAEGTTPASKSQSDVVTGIGTLSTNRYNDAKTDYEPVSTVLTQAGHVVVFNSAQQVIFSQDHVDASYSSGYSAGSYNSYMDNHPTSATLSDAGALSVKNIGGTEVYSETFSNNYNKGKIDFNPTSATLSNAGALTVTNSTGTTRLTKTFTNSYDAGVTATKKGNATAAQVFAGKTFTNSSGVNLTGTYHGYWVGTPKYINVAANTSASSMYIWDTAAATSKGYVKGTTGKYDWKSGNSFNAVGPMTFIMLYPYALVAQPSGTYVRVRRYKKSGTSYVVSSTYWISTGNGASSAVTYAEGSTTLGTIQVGASSGSAPYITVSLTNTSTWVMCDYELYIY